MKLRMIAIVLATSAGLGHVLAAPAGLIGKTIHVSFTSTTPIKRTNGSIGAASRTISRTIYVSSAGRFFTERRDTAKTGTQVRKGAPDAASRYYRFEGNKLIVTTPAGQNRARQVVVSFDSGFQSCKVDAKMGTTGGTATWKGLDGARYTAAGATSISNTSCSIESGNAFAQ